MQNSTSSVDEIIKNTKKLSTDTDNNSFINIKSTDISRTTDSAGFWSDYYIDKIYSDLINPQYRAWYCERFYKLGKSRVEALATIARKGNHPQRYFSFLLKQS